MTLQNLTRDCVAVGSDGGPQFAPEALRAAAGSHYFAPSLHGIRFEGRERWTYEFALFASSPSMVRILPGLGTGMPDRDASDKALSARQFLKYPKFMLDQRKEGDVMVECTVSLTGATKDCVVLQANSPEFGQAALAYCIQAIYMPAVQNGVPVEQRRSWKLTFRLGS